MSSTGHRDTEASVSPNIQGNRESASGPKIKIAKKDSLSVGDLRDTTGCGSYTMLFLFWELSRACTCFYELVVISSQWLFLKNYIKKCI